MTDKAQTNKPASSCRVYAYGISTNFKHGLSHPDYDKLELLTRSTNQLYNNMIEVVRQTWEARQKIIRAAHPDLTAVLDEIDDLNQQIDLEIARVKTLNAKARKHVTDSADVAELEKLKAKRQKAIARRKELYAEHVRSPQEVQDIAKQISAISKKQKKHKKGSPEAIQKAELQQQRRELLETTGGAAKACADLDVACAEQIKKLRTHRLAGLLPSTTATAVQAAVKQATQAAAKRGQAPRFKRFEGDGKLDLQFTVPPTVEDLLDGKNTYARIELIDKSRPQDKQRAVLWYRIGSDPECRRKAVWLKLPMLLHRPLPPKAAVKRIWIVRKRIGLQTKYSAQFVLDLSAAEHVSDAASSGHVHIRLNPRRDEIGDIELGTWTGSDGDAGVISLNQAHLDRLNFVTNLQAVCTQDFNMAIAALGAWKSGAKPPPQLATFTDWLQVRVSTADPANSQRLAMKTQELATWQKLMATWSPQAFPEPLRTELTHLHAWRSPRRLVAFIERFWGANRFAGDSELFDAMTAWVQRWRHIEDWQAHVRARTIRWRTDTFRKTVADLRRKYYSATINISALEVMRKKPKTGKPDVYAGVRPFLKQAAVSTLATLLAQAFGERATVLKTVSSQNQAPPGSEQELAPVSTGT